MTLVGKRLNNDLYFESVLLFGDSDGILGQFKGVIRVKLDDISLFKLLDHLLHIV
jgi:hypothetical protein